MPACTRVTTRGSAIAIVIAALTVALASTPRADAQTTSEIGTTSSLVLPPPPSAAPPWWELEIGALAVVPLERSAVCPADRDCVLNAGVGLAARVTRRSADGVGWGFAYQLSVLDSASLYEIALLHSLRGHVRYVLDTSARVQPWIGASVGVLLFGDASNVATGGALVSAEVGAHVELTRDFAVFASAAACVLALGPFATRDGVMRGDPFGVSLVLEVALGVMIRIDAVQRH